jgi:hypothetical protein
MEKEQPNFGLQSRTVDCRTNKKVSNSFLQEYRGEDGEMNPPPGGDMSWKVEIV